MISRNFVTSILDSNIRNSTAPNLSSFILKRYQSTSVPPPSDDDNDKSKKNINKTKDNGYKIMHRDTSPNLENSLQTPSINYETLYKNDKRFIPIPECPSCGTMGERINPKINSPFFTCPNCKTAYMSRSPVKLSMGEGNDIGVNDSDDYRKSKEKKMIDDYIEENRNDLPPSPRLREFF